MVSTREHIESVRKAEKKNPVKTRIDAAFRQARGFIQHNENTKLGEAYKANPNYYEKKLAEFYEAYKEQK